MFMWESIDSKLDLLKVTVGQTSPAATLPDLAAESTG
jgi:hypothetical protein